MSIACPSGSSLVFINQFYWPDESATSQLLCDVTSGTAQGKPVAVICGGAAYSPAAGDRAPDGVEIRRVRAARFGHGLPRKLWSYLSFAAGALAQVARSSPGDVIVTMTTPPLLGILGWIGQRRGARHYIWEMDLYPDVAVELGVFRRGGLLDRITGHLADFPRRRADGIIALGPCMEQRLRQRPIGAVPIHVVHNWADGARIQSLPFQSDGRLKLFYSGNMGLAHDFETVLPAIAELGPDFVFRFSGAGPRRAELERATAALPNCEFQGYHLRGQLAEAFAANDVGLVTQRAETMGTVVPSKFYGILAAGRAVVYIGPSDSTVGKIIAEHAVGWQVDNGDSSGLVRLLRHLRANPELVITTGNRARAVFEREFDMPGQVQKILSIIG